VTHWSPLKVSTTADVPYYTVHTVLSLDVHRVSEKLCNLFLSELCRTSTNFDNFWQKDGKEAQIMRGALIFHLI